jgi:hypothetical protein
MQLLAAEQPEGDPSRVVALALARLSALDAEMARALANYYMSGMSMPEVREMSALDTSTFQRRWAAAIAWLKENLHPPFE